MFSKEMFLDSPISIRQNCAIASLLSDSSVIASFTSPKCVFFDRSVLFMTILYTVSISSSFIVSALVIFDTSANILLTHCVFLCLLITYIPLEQRIRCRFHHLWHIYHHINCQLLLIRMQVLQSNVKELLPIVLWFFH